MQEIVMVSHCVNLTSVYAFTIGKFILTCLQVFIIKISAFCLDCKNFIFWLFSLKFLLSHCAFNFPKFYWEFDFRVVPLMLFYMSHGNIFVWIQRCRGQCWLNLLRFLFDNYLVGKKYLYCLYCGSCSYQPPFH